MANKKILLSRIENARHALLFLISDLPDCLHIMPNQKECDDHSCESAKQCSFRIRQVLHQLNHATYALFAMEHMFMIESGSYEHFCIHRAAHLEITEMLNSACAAASESENLLPVINMMSAFERMLIDHLSSVNIETHLFRSVRLENHTFGLPHTSPIPKDALHNGSITDGALG